MKSEFFSSYLFVFGYLFFFKIKYCLHLVIFVHSNLLNCGVVFWSLCNWYQNTALQFSLHVYAESMLRNTTLICSYSSYMVWRNSLYLEGGDILLYHTYGNESAFCLNSKTINIPFRK